MVVFRRTYRRDKDAMQDFFFIFGNENDYRMIARLDDVVFSRREGDEGVPLVVIYPKRKKARDILLMDTYEQCTTSIAPKRKCYYRRG